MQSKINQTKKFAITVLWNVKEKVKFIGTERIEKWLLGAEERGKHGKVAPEAVKKKKGCPG